MARKSFSCPRAIFPFLASITLKKFLYYLFVEKKMNILNIFEDEKSCISPSIIFCSSSRLLSFLHKMCLDYGEELLHIFYGIK